MRVNKKQTDHYFISIDIGTQGTKIALIQEQGTIVARSFIPSLLIQSERGAIEQNPDDMFSSVLDGIRNVMEQTNIAPQSVLAIGMDGQMAGIMGIDRQGEAVTPYDSWLDTRCEKYIPLIKNWGEEEFIRITGCPVTYAHGPKILWWKHEKPEAYGRIAKFVLPTSYIAGRLCELAADEAYIDYTHLHFSGFADVLKMTWSDVLLEAFQIDRDKMPRIVYPWDVVGNLSKRNAELCGLIEGVPVVAGCGDTAATIFGAGITSNGQLLDVAGTASVLSCCVDEYSADVDSKTLIYARSILPGLWTPLAYINGGGQCLAWFKELLTRQGDPVSFDELNEGAAGQSVGSDDLYFIPHFSGRVCPNNPFLRGSWFGMKWSHNSYHLFRSILESIAYEYKVYLDTLSQLVKDIPFTQVTVVGGGARSDLFNSIKADVLNVPYAKLDNNDTALLANAVIAGYGVGFYDSLSGTMERMVQTSHQVLPQSNHHTQYVTYASNYNKLLQCLTPIYQELQQITTGS